MKRITWEKLKIHPFWAPYEITTYQIPPQPHFENWVNTKRQDETKMKKEEELETKTEIRSNSQKHLLKNIGNEKEINLLRLIFFYKK